MLASTFTERAVAVKQLVNTHFDSVLSSQSMNNAALLRPYSHEEADARMIVCINLVHEAND